MILNGQIVTAVSIGGQVVAKRGLKGDKGDTGDTGATGNGISSAILNQDYTLTLTFTNGTTYTTPSIRGQQGETGQTGATGDSGVYVGTTEPTDPSVMVWVDESDPAIVVNATVDGSTGTPSCDVTYDNEGLYFAFHNLKGGKGDTGNTGATGNGIASISKTGTSGKVDTYTITFTNGTTTTFTVTNGNDGSSAWADITGKPETFPPSSHNHNDLYYGKSDTYTKTETDSAISSHHDSTKADTTHNHDTRYYTESETDALLDAKADTEDIPTKTSDLTNDSGFITEHQSLSAYRTSADQDVIDSGKVDKVEGKGLSTEDYTTAEKTKLSGIEANADVTDADNVKSSGATMGVKVAGTELVKDSDGKVNVPYAGQHTAGLFKAWYSRGSRVTSDGYLEAYNERSYINNRNLGGYDSAFLALGKINYAVKCALSDANRIGTETTSSTAMTDAEKHNACEVIGASMQIVKTTLDAVAVSGASYFLGTQSTVAITLPSTPSVGDEILVCFTSGATACTLTCDLQGFSFVPKANKTSWIKFTCYDATSGSVKWLVETKEG